MTSFLEGRTAAASATAPASAAGVVPFGKSSATASALTAPAFPPISQARTENTPAGFQPFFSALGRQPLPGKTDATEAPAHTRTADAALHDAPQVELITGPGGKIERIIVTCTCCERIELECKY